MTIREVLADRTPRFSGRVRRQAAGLALHRRFALASGLVMVFMLLPVVVVVGVSLDSSTFYQFPPRDISLRWFASFFASHTFVDSFFRVSLPLALGVAAVSTLIGTLAAIGLVRTNFRGKAVIETLFVIPLIFPQIILAVGLFLTFVRLGGSPGLVSLLLGHIVICCPYVVRTVVSGLVGIDPRLEEAAKNLGASPIRAFYLVSLPLLRSSIISGALFAFIVSFSDVNLALFLSTANTMPLTMQILSQIQHDSNPTIAAAATIQVIVISMILLGIQRLIGTLRV